MKLNTGISDNHAKAIASILNTLLSDEYLLYTKTRKYHWNVEGMNFGPLHKLFENQYEELANMIDEIAERVRQIGYYALGTMAGFLKTTRLAEDADETTTSENMILNLLNDHETIIRILRKEFEKTDEKHKDHSTGDFLVDLAKEHEKMAWMLRAHLNK